LRVIIAKYSNFPGKAALFSREYFWGFRIYPLKSWPDNCRRPHRGRHKNSDELTLIPANITLKSSFIKEGNISSTELY